MAILTLLPNFPSIGGCDALLKGALRYGPIGGKINDANFLLDIGMKSFYAEGKASDVCPEA